ncbi:hypothetical protein [Secundilactobacillus odoratitofui]|uniref:hypothetical protein n=1 Tax=Secundilactobacillus odoratitofui TaxID=480930 RepID=UPI002092E35B|nr:hypothetical protein [Secundilactobacillus odoratitofui]
MVVVSQPQKKAIESYWPFVQTQLTKLSDPVVEVELKDLHKSVSRYGLQRLTGYQAAGGTYGPTVKASCPRAMTS